ncbi:PilZ domain-containing protein [Oleidesulfovibrio alaskensis]|uniref:PilZ domain-containing protein n=1 Tax=Oleidesulfovibrio alaskensis TaxID=58180 RepID=UPI001A36D58E|nr:PilZ domain-containing protein [Oleidesulfovibrio alaskensis]MBL3581198.1 PilZ domain-containing protein [Oleidesulfovibrio alaskensis]
MDDRRRRLRVPARYAVHLEYGGSRNRALTLDLSLRRALCIAHPPLPVGAACRFLLTLAEGYELSVDAEVVRAESDETALRFTAMSPETYAHLRSMVELLAGDADGVEAEETVPFQ